MGVPVRVRPWPLLPKFGRHCYKYYMSISNSVFLFDEHPGKGWSRKPAGTWICKYCGKDCETKHNLLEHYKSHPEYKQVTRHDDNKWECEYCKETFRTRKLLFNHYKECPIKHSLPHDSLGRVIKPEREINRLKSFNDNFKSGKIIPWNRGKKNTPEHNAHIAEGTQRYLNKQLEEKGQVLFPRVNNNACIYIEHLNEERNWHLQHGLNGGEIHVGPYSLDGYDKDLNIVFEYDEPHHYKDIEHNILSDRDIRRMQYIKEQLKCKFYRYNEKLNLLYEC